MDQVYENVDSSVPFQFFTMKEYYRQAKAVMKFFDLNFHYVDNDYIGHVAEEMMIADWQYSDDKGMSRNSFRVNRAKYAILNYYNRYIKPLQSFKPLNNNISKDYRREIRNECPITLDELIEKIDQCKMKDVFKDCIKDRFIKGKSVKTIATEQNISRQYVYERIKKGLSHLKTSLPKDCKLVNQS